MTVGKILQDAGYVTGLVGKWGLGDQGMPGEPMKQGFDYSFGYLSQVHAHDYWTDHLFRNGQRIAKPIIVYSHDLCAAESLDFIRREKEKPFFLYAAFTPPHGDINPPNDGPYEKEDWPSKNKKFAAMVTRLDQTVGEIMALLDELKLPLNISIEADEMEATPFPIVIHRVLQAVSIRASPAQNAVPVRGL